MLPLFKLVHIVVILLTLLAISTLFVENGLLFAAIPLLIYVLIHRKNTMLLYHMAVIKSFNKDIQIVFDKEAEDFFFGRELFVLAMLNLVIAIIGSNIINLFAAMYLSYVSIVQLNYLKNINNTRTQ